ncbi:MAG: hypothetical protein IPP51_04820 [Bacteroidetes bacterium]|nr:hypothetical protein [Bacteroidota bacterium]
MRNILLYIFLLLSLTSGANKPDSTRAELMHLLKDRAELFQTYSQSLQKHSGIFGGRTKNDMRYSQDQLHSIIELDNKIMGSLNRALDYRNFEKLNYTYDSKAADDKNKTLQQNNETLLARNTILEKENDKIAGEIARYRFYFVILLLLIVGLTVMLVRCKLR